MKRFNRLFQKSVITALSIAFVCSSYSFAELVREGEGTDLVARITVIEGQLERFDPETQEWIVTVPDAPVGVGDQIFAGTDSRVEILVPNNTVLRIGGETEARFVSLTELLSEIDFFSGTARLYNNSSRTNIVATTQFGYIEVPPGASVDLDIDDKAVEIIPLDGSVYFTGNQLSGRHEIIAGSASLMAFSDRIMPASGSVDRSWNAWNRDRDALWAEQRRTSGESKDYIPASLNDEAYILDTYGSWNQVYYEGDYYRFWRPRYIDVGWSPFSVGMWMTWRGDRVWIPREPFGYVTHHYGNWIYTQGTWYWAPPVSRTRVRSGFPLLNIEFCWYPGRVAWLDAGIYMHWIALAPFEPFYCRYPWGLRTVVIANNRPYPRYVASHKFKYRQCVVTGHQNHFYRKERGSHVSKWRATNRSGVHGPPVYRDMDRPETRSFRATREKSDENRIRENGKPEGGTNRDRGKFDGTRARKDHDGNVVEQRRRGLANQNRTQPAGTTQQPGLQNRSGVNRTDKNPVRTNSHERTDVQNNNRRGAKNSEDNRESMAVVNNETVSGSQEKSRQSNGQPAERRSNEPAKQNRYQSSANTFQQSGSQNRPGLTRSDNNTVRSNNRAYRPR